VANSKAVSDDEEAAKCNKVLPKPSRKLISALESVIPVEKATVDDISCRLPFNDKDGEVPKLPGLPIAKPRRFHRHVHAPPSAHAFYTKNGDF